MEIVEYKRIPKFTENIIYGFDASPKEMMRWLKREQAEMGLNMRPKFQGMHVWTKQQQAAYIEYRLCGGQDGITITLNCPWWEEGKPGSAGYQDYVCVDGLMRIQAWESFFADEIRIFGTFHSEFTGHFPNTVRMRIQMENRKDEASVIARYLEINEGVTPHTPAELEKVRDMMRQAARKDGKYGKTDGSL